MHWNNFQNNRVKMKTLKKKESTKNAKNTLHTHFPLLPVNLFSFFELTFVVVGCKSKSSFCVYLWVCLCVYECVCMCVCVCERERERDRERDIQRQSLGDFLSHFLQSAIGLSVVHNFPISFVCLFNLPTSLVTAADTRSYLTIFRKWFLV